MSHRRLPETRLCSECGKPFHPWENARGTTCSQPCTSRMNGRKRSEAVRQRTEKACGRCKVVMPLEAFVRKSREADGRGNYCLECNRAVTRRGQVQHRYGISAEQKEAMYETQQGKCAVCGREGALTGRGCLYVDHDHETGKARGLVCPRCNTAIGGLESPVRAAAERYLREHGTDCYDAAGWPHGKAVA